MTGNEEADSFLPTRKSLLSRLKDWDDQDGWRDFFDSYSGLIFNVLRRAGLKSAEAEDVTQEVLLTVAKQMPSFRYDPAKGSFKTWLHTVIRSRLVEHFRRGQSLARVIAPTPATDGAADTDFVRNVADSAAADSFDAIWQSEWEHGLLETALRRVRAKVSARQYLIFSLSTLKETPISTITKKLDVNVAQVYLAKHRVAKMVKAELTKLRMERP